MNEDRSTYGHTYANMSLMTTSPTYTSGRLRQRSFCPLSLYSLYGVFLVILIERGSSFVAHLPGPRARGPHGRDGLTGGLGAAPGLNPLSTSTITGEHYHQRDNVELLRTAPGLLESIITGPEDGHPRGRGAIGSTFRGCNRRWRRHATGRAWRICHSKRYRTTRMG